MDSAVSTVFSILDAVGSKASQFSEWETLPGVPNLTILLAVWVCWEFWRNADGKRMMPLQAMVATYAVGFGGSTIAAIMLGKPWGLLKGNASILVYMTVAPIIYYSPNGAVLNVLESARFALAPLLTVVEAVSKAGTVANVGVEGVLSMKDPIWQSSIASAIIVGTISGCGGGVLGSLLGLRNASWSLNTPAQFISPNKSMVLSFMASVIYIALRRTPLLGKTAVVSWLLVLLNSAGFRVNMSTPFMSESQTMGLMVVMIWCCNNSTWMAEIHSIMTKNVAALLQGMPKRQSVGSKAYTNNLPPVPKAGKSRPRATSLKRKVM